MVYSTQDLIQILDAEMRATWRGDRVLLAPDERLSNPVIAKAIDGQKAAKVFAYQDFRAQIHEYQRQHSVSGLIWRVCTFQGRSIRYPELHNQLIPVAGDKEKLMTAKPLVLDFWRENTLDMNFWLSVHRHRPLSLDSLADLMAEAEWAEIDAAQTELYLGLCWGDPQHYQYQWAKPESGCHRVIATHDQPSSIKV
jgi:hypothetical protein